MTRVYTSTPNHLSDTNFSQEDSGFYSVNSEFLRPKNVPIYDWEERRFVGPNELTAYEKSRSRSVSPMTYGGRNSMSLGWKNEVMDEKPLNVEVPLPMVVVTLPSPISPTGASSKTTFGGGVERDESDPRPIRHTMSHESLYRSEHVKYPPRDQKIKEEFMKETIVRISNGVYSSDTLERTRSPPHFLKRTRSETRLLPWGSNQKLEDMENGRNGSFDGSNGYLHHHRLKLYSSEQKNPDKVKNGNFFLYQLYLSLCEDCQLKKSKKRKGLVVKPILSEEMNARCQVDLIDMQAQAYGEYRYILVYQDHLTKFVVLRALKTKTAEVVAAELIQIFAIFGVPRILHTDNGREFENKVVRKVLEKWPECKMVHGKTRHSQTQGSVERANQDIENMLAAHLNENKTANWVDALPIIQVAKNRRFHRGIGKSPYEVMFGRKMTMGIGDDGLSKTSIEKINDEEDLRKAFNVAEDQKKPEEMESTSEVEEITMDQSSTSAQSSRSRPSEKRQRCEIEEPTPSTSESYRYEEPYFGPYYEKMQHSIKENREVARKTQKKQADQMLARSDLTFATVSMGTNVAIPVPTFDRGKVDHRNIMGVVLQEDNGLYQLGTEQGILPQRYTRNQFEPLDPVS